MKGRMWWWTAAILTAALMALTPACGGDDDDDDSASDDDTADDDGDDDTADDDTADDDTGDDDTTDDDTTDDDTEPEPDIVVDFEDMDTDADPTAPWLVDEQGPSSDVIVTDNLPGDTVVKAASGHVLKLTTGSNTDNAARAILPVDDTLIDKAEVRMDLYMSGAPGAAYFGAILALPSSIIHLLTNDALDEDDFISGSLVPSSEQDCDAMKTNTWVDYRVVIDRTSWTTDSYVDGEACATDLPLDERLMTLGFLGFYLPSGYLTEREMYIDNIEVTFDPWETTENGCENGISRLAQCGLFSDKTHDESVALCESDDDEYKCVATCGQAPPTTSCEDIQDCISDVCET